MFADPKIRQQLAAPDCIRLAPPCTAQPLHHSAPSSGPLKFNAKQQMRDARQGKPLKMDAIRRDSTRLNSTRLIIISVHGLHLIPAALGDNGSLAQCVCWEEIWTPKTTLQRPRGYFVLHMEMRHRQRDLWAQKNEEEKNVSIPFLLRISFIVCFFFFFATICVQFC